MKKKTNTESKLPITTKLGKEKCGGHCIMCEYCIQGVCMYEEQEYELESCNIFCFFKNDEIDITKILNNFKLSI